MKGLSSKIQPHIFQGSSGPQAPNQATVVLKSSLSGWLITAGQPLNLTKCQGLMLIARLTLVVHALVKIFKCGESAKYCHTWFGASTNRTSVNRAYLHIA